MAYADYQYYSETYGGTFVPAEDFGRLAAMAGRRMDRDTDGRVKSFAGRWFVTDCCCALAEELYSQERQRKGGVVKSESRGKVAVSYDTAGALAPLGAEQRLRRLEDAYLGAWGLMYRGS